MIFGDVTGANVVNGVAYTGNSVYSMVVGSVQAQTVKNLAFSHFI